MNERDETHAHLYRLAQARAFLRALEEAVPPGAIWKSTEKIANDILQQALVQLARTPDARFQPSREDYRTVQREADQEAS